MAVQIQTYRPTLNAGQVYMRVAGSAKPLAAIGNVSVLELEITEEEKSLADHTAPGGGQWAALSRVTGVNAKMTLHDLDPVNLSRQVYGDVASKVGAAVVDEAHTAYQGGLIRLAHPNPTAVTVTSSPSGTTYVANVDYEVRKEGVLILDGAIADAAPVLIDYTYGAYSVVEALTAGSLIYELSFGGLNEANNNSPVVLDVFKLKVSAAKTLSFIGDDFASLEVTGKVLMDATKTGAGISKYFRVQMV